MSAENVVKKKIIGDSDNWNLNRNRESLNNRTLQKQLIKPALLNVI